MRVHVYRTTARGNPLRTLMGRFFGVNTANIDAVATAEASPANAMTCVKPFTIPDKWIEKQDRAATIADSTFDMDDSHGNPLANPDIYIPADSDGYTGYNAESDKGTADHDPRRHGQQHQPSFYFSYADGRRHRRRRYRWNIANCNTTMMGWGDLLLQEPGNMVGPTNQGIDDLIAKDPNAYWDTSANKSVSHMHPSPRVVAIPVYDPVYYAPARRTAATPTSRSRTTWASSSKRRQGNNVYGRITPIGGLVKGTGCGRRRRVRSRKPFVSWSSSPWPNLRHSSSRKTKNSDASIGRLLRAGGVPIGVIEDDRRAPSSRRPTWSSSTSAATLPPGWRRSSACAPRIRRPRSSPSRRRPIPS